MAGRDSPLPLGYPWPATAPDAALRRPILLLPLLLLACGDRYSPDTYATRAVQQANKVEQGVVVGVRAVQITAEGTTGAAAGAAAGGVIGAQTPGGGIGAALGGVGGALVGGLIGRAAESAAVDTPAREYVVRTDREELLSVTQRDQVPLVVGQRVLVITGVQARIVPDYTVATGPARPAAPPPAQEARQEPPAPAAATVDPVAAAAAGVLQ
ncbi:hypothetical protein CKO45_28430, partial [Paracraurococcus ruber]|nr:hypothetical protein [Paracraurococcus ruber]